MNNLGKIINKLLMVISVCQLGWAMVSKYLVKRCSGHFCEGDFLVRLAFRSMDSEKIKKLLSII